LSDAEPGPSDLLMIKRRAENADRFASASLQRMLAEPGVRSTSSERATSLTTYNQRITRACTAIAVYLQDNPSMREAGISALAVEIADVLETLAQAIEQDGTGPAAAELAPRLGALENLLATAPLSAPTTASSWSSTDLIWIHLAKSIAEIRAMGLVLDTSIENTVA
jgi:uncharacterized membrane protein YccC